MLKYFLFLFFVFFILPLRADNFCHSLFNAVEVQQRPVLAENTYRIYQDSALDLIEIYDPSSVYAVARAIIIKDFNDNIKDIKIVKSNKVNFYIDVRHFDGTYQYQIHFSALPGEYFIHFLNKDHGVSNRLIRKEQLILN